MKDFANFPNRKNVKWGSMTAGDSHLSDEWHGMEPSSGHMSEKWVSQEPSAPRMSEKWVEIETGGSPNSDKWHDMKQEGREDPYTMNPSTGDRTQPFKAMKKETPDNKVERKTQHTEFGSTREN